MAAELKDCLGTSSHYAHRGLKGHRQEHGHGKEQSSRRRQKHSALPAGLVWGPKSTLTGLKTDYIERDNRKYYLDLKGKPAGSSLRIRQTMMRGTGMIGYLATLWA